EGYEMIEEFEFERDTFDRQRNAERIELDRRLKALNHRERFVITKRCLIGECKEVFERVSDYITPGYQLKVPLEQAEIATLFGVPPRRISQIERRAKDKLKEVRSDLPVFPHGDPHFVTQRWNDATFNRFSVCAKRDEYPYDPL